MIKLINLPKDFENPHGIEITNENGYKTIERFAVLDYTVIRIYESLDCNSKTKRLIHLFDISIESVRWLD